MDFKNIVLMKYGVHASENVDSIFQRKLCEIENTGKMFWGYGGTICHPLKQIQPFININIANKEKTYLLLTRTKSNFNNTPTKGTLFSKNAVDWEIIPESINVLGSKYALICTDLQPYNGSINLCEYTVGIGASKGKCAAEYFKGRVDKGCFSKMDIKNEQSTAVNISWIAEIIGAVYIK